MKMRKRFLRPSYRGAMGAGRLARQREVVLAAWIAEYAFLGFLLCLVYKLDRLGVILLFSLSLTLIKLPFPKKQIFTPLSLTAIAYVAIALITAIFVSLADGIYRTIQFCATVAASIAIYSYIKSLNASEVSTLVKKIMILNCAVLVHMVVYHIYHGHYVTWKYLYDTKLVLSSSVILLFYYEDEIKARWNTTGWVISLGALSIAILCSGERKAYVLLILVFLMSRARLMSKISVAMCVVGLAIAYITLAPANSYVARQLRSVSMGETSHAETPSRYFLTRQGIGDQSDEIRTFVNRNARRLFMQNPVFGLGATGYSHWARKTYGYTGLSMNVHGEINRVPVEGGMLGIVIGLLYFYFLLMKTIRYNFSGWSFRTTSRQRTTLYLATFMITYLYSEALDTTMLMLVLLVGFITAGLTFEQSRRPFMDRTRQRADILDGARKRLLVQPADPNNSGLARGR